MAGINVTSAHIRKLGHSIKEIRERALKSLASKLKYGFQFDDELSRSKELLHLLFIWFQFDNPQCQLEVLEILHIILKSHSGKVLINHIGSGSLLRDLEEIRDKLDLEHLDLLASIENYIHAQNIDHHNEKTDVPHLDIPESIDEDFNSVHLSPNTPKYTYRVNANDFNLRGVDHNGSTPHPLADLDHIKLGDLYSQGIKIYLLPWSQLCDSDTHTILMIQDALKMGQSIERSARFFLDVLLKDFPPEVFLNRHSIMKGFYQILDNENFSVLSIEALLALTISLNSRINQLYDPSLRNCKKIQYEDSEISESHFMQCEKTNEPLSDNYAKETVHEVSAIALNQVTLPSFCLDTLYIILKAFGQSAPQSSASSKNEFCFSMKEMNLALKLCFSVSQVLFRAVSITVWKEQPSNKLVQQIIQKIIMVLRTCGDLLNKLRLSCIMSKMTHPLYRINYLRLLSFCVSLAQWCNSSYLIPTTFSSSLCSTLSDVTCAILYPDLYNEAFKCVQNFEIKTLEDRENMIMYKDTNGISKSMRYAIKIVKNYDSLCESPGIIEIVKKSLQSLEFHESKKFVTLILDILSLKLPKWKLTDNHKSDVKVIVLELLGHSCAWIQEAFYSGVHSVVLSVLGGIMPQDKSSNRFTQRSIMFLLDSSIFLEICNHGLDSEIKAVNDLAKDIIQHCLRGKLLIVDTLWDILLQAMLPALPLLHAHAAHDKAFGKSIIKTLDLKIGQCMLIPKIDLIKGNIRLLFTGCFTAQMEGALNLSKFLSLQEDADNYLPKHDAIRPDLLCSSLRSISPKNFNVIKNGDPAFYQEGPMLQVMDMLKIKVSSDTGGISNDEHSRRQPDIDPTFRRSAFVQLAIMLQQPTLHPTFLSNNGCKVIAHYLKYSLCTHEYTTFPEVAISCVSILNSLLYCSSSIRLWASEQQDLILNVIRAFLLFPNDEGFCTTVSQLLFLLAFGQVTINACDVAEINSEDISSELSLPFCLSKKLIFPFKCNYHSKCSVHRKPEKREILMGDASISRSLRIQWCTAWYEGVDKVLRWPYIPESTNFEDFSSSLMITNSDLTDLKVSCPVQGIVSALYDVQNATSHHSVNNALDLLTGYILLVHDSQRGMKELSCLPWRNTFYRFVTSPPASPKDSVLLLNVTKFLSTFVHFLKGSDFEDYTSVFWIIESLLETSRGITSLLKYSKSDSNWTDNFDEVSPKLRQSIIELISECCCLYDILYCENQNLEVISWGGVTEFLTFCLLDVDVYNFYSIAYIGQVVECLTHLTFTPHHGLFNRQSVQSTLIRNLARIIVVSHIGNGYNGYKGYALVKNSFVVLCQLLDIALMEENEKEYWLDVWLFEEGDNVLSACLLWYNSTHILIRSLAFKLLQGFFSQSSILVYLEDKTDDIEGGIIGVAINSLTDLTEASLQREQAAILLSNMLACQKIMKFYPNSSTDILFSADFFSKITSTLTKVCLNEVEEFEAGENIPLELLSNRNRLEVAISKREFNLPLKLAAISSPKCSLGLLKAIADVMYNLLLHNEKIPVNMDKSGMFRILFRCIGLKLPMSEAKVITLTAICRMLCKVAIMSDEVHAMLVDTQDCVSDLLSLFLPDYSAFRVVQMTGSVENLWNWAFLLTGTLIETLKGYRCVWNILVDSGICNFLHCLLISTSEIKNKDVCLSAMYCLVNFFNGYSSFKTVDDDVVTMESLLDQKVNITDAMHIQRVANKQEKYLFSIPPSYREEIIHHTKQSDYVFSQDLCSTLLNLYRALETYININSMQRDPRYKFIASALCSLLAQSEKAKIIIVESDFIPEQIEKLSKIHYTLVSTEKPMDIIKNKNHCIVNRLDWIIQLLCNAMANCNDAKEQCASYNLIVPINKLWPWCISNNKIRYHTIQMLCVYTNDCPKANQSMQITVGSNSLITEIIDLIGKEMNLVSRRHSLATLQGCLQVLGNVSSHVHCRAIILKSDIFGNFNKIHPAVTKRQPQWKEVESLWESFAITMTRYPEGQVKLAEYFSVLCALVHQSNGITLTVLRNCAFNPYNRPKFLGSAEILQLFSTILASNDLLEEKLIVCGALWALGANHLKSKLSLRTIGLTAKLTDCLHRLKYTSNEDYENDRAIQIITYVIKVISIN